MTEQQRQTAIKAARDGQSPAHAEKTTEQLGERLHRLERGLSLATKTLEAIERASDDDYESVEEFRGAIRFQLAQRKPGAGG